MRTPTKSNPKPARPHEWWRIDTPKVLVHGGVRSLSWWYAIGVPKRWRDPLLGIQGKAEAWPSALDMAVHRPFPAGKA
jgi:putative transposase